MRNSPPLIVWLVAMTLASAILYFIWPYLVAFLALCGAFQLLRAWNKSHRNFRK